MNQNARIFSPISFGVVLIAFFLPFFTVSCPTAWLVRVSGWNLVSGSAPEINPQLTKMMTEGLQGLKPKAPDSFPGSDSGTTASPLPGPTNLNFGMKPEAMAEKARTGKTGRVMAVGAFLLALAGLALFFFPSEIGAGAIPAACGGVGAVALLVLKAGMRPPQMAQAEMFGFRIQTEYGFWIAFAGFLAAVGVNLWLHQQRRAEALADAERRFDGPRAPLSHAYPDFPGEAPEGAAPPSSAEEGGRAPRAPIPVSGQTPIDKP